MKKLLLLLAGVLLHAGPASAAPPKTRLDVFAAASLTDAFDEIGKAFEHAHPGVQVRMQYAGSQQLAAQIEQGARADVIATADIRWMGYLKDHAMLVPGDAQVFAHNSLVVIVPKTNPGRVRKISDLARAGLKIVVGAQAVPVGDYTRNVLRRLSETPECGAEFGRNVWRNVVSQEENVKSVVGKVQLGEADAGFCYRSDVTPAAGRLIREFVIPDSVNEFAEYPIAVVAHSPRAALAREFIAFVLSPAGQEMLAKQRFASADAIWP